MFKLAKWAYDNWNQKQPISQEWADGIKPQKVRKPRGEE